MVPKKESMESKFEKKKLVNLVNTHRAYEYLLYNSGNIPIDLKLFRIKVGRRS